MIETKFLVKWTTQQKSICAVSNAPKIPVLGYNANFEAKMLTKMTRTQSETTRHWLDFIFIHIIKWAAHVVVSN